MPFNSAIAAMVISLVWWIVHCLQNEFQWLVNGDISEIAIAMSYILYVPLYYAVFKMWRNGEIKGLGYGIIFPIFATLGSILYL